jgi:hypothetical protein
MCCCVGKQIEAKEVKMAMLAILRASRGSGRSRHTSGAHHQPLIAVTVRRASRRWQILRRSGRRRLKELRNILGLVYPFRRAGGEALIFVRHRMLGRLSIRVIKLLRQPTRFLRAETPMSRIGQKLGH